MIKDAFQTLVRQYAATPEAADHLWQEIEIAYTEADRHFHNLDHLNHLLRELQPLQPKIKEWETLLLSLVYHDVVYDVTQNIVSNDNEERSAAFAERQLLSIGYPPEKIERCKAQIMATKTHHLAQDHDTNLLTDADLCILGQPWKVYNAYQKNIRKEFLLYPDNIYHAGRKKVLGQFLRMRPLFKTKHFYQLYEEAAKENMRKEIALLEA